MSRTLALVFMMALAVEAASAMVPVTLRTAMQNDSPSPAAASGSTVMLDEQTSGGATVSTGARLQVRLRAQLGAGYSWSLVGAPPPTLKMLGERIERPPGPPAEGGHDLQVFSFEAIGPGPARLDFVYRRPFGPQDQAARHVIFDIVVAGR
jgi:predicted secreted protein